MTRAADLHAAIYAPDEIRGRIIQKRLALEGLASVHGPHPNGLLAGLPPGVAPGVLVLDVYRQALRQWDTVRELADCFPEVPLLLITSSGEDGRVAQKLAADPHCRGRTVAGPIDPERILAAVLQLLAQRRCHTSSAKALRNDKRKANHPAPRQAHGARNGVAHHLMRAAVLLAMLLTGMAGGYGYWCFTSLPDVERLSSLPPYRASAIFSYDNHKLSEFFIQRRASVPLERIPATVRSAFVAVEDARFFDHHGIDLIRTMGALWVDIRKGSYAQGGSTITQQLAKMLFLTPRKTLTRKLQEMIIALKLEKQHTKREILERYLNQVYFGTRAYGIEAAARTYLGKTVEELTLAEGALLAGLIKAPSRYSPFRNPQLAEKRRNHVLQRMRETGAITAAVHSLALKTPVPRTYRGKRYKAPYFVEYCRRILEKRYGQRLYTSGFQVFTTLDYRLQQVAEAAVERGIAAIEERGRKKKVQAALLAMEIASGRILSMVGGRDFWQSQFNRATQARRQPGSAFKPVVYLTALDNGFHPHTPIPDDPVSLSSGRNRPPWTPANYDGRTHGVVSLEQALSRSYNLATIHLARTLGMDKIIRTARRIGIKSRIHPFYPSALGASELTLVELVCAYAALASGVRTPPRVIDQVIDGESLSRWSPAATAIPVVSQAVRKEMRQMLRKVVTEGTARRAGGLGREVYGKTGTTNDCADALFIGFDDRMVVGVWVGLDDRISLGRRETGSRAALPIWIDFMKVAGSLPPSRPAQAGFSEKVMATRH
jgi:penicillin-binding protein 1A